MFEYIYFIGTGCGRPVASRQLPSYLVGLSEDKSILLECGASIITDSGSMPTRLTQIDVIIISAMDIELFVGLPSLLHSMRLLNRAKPLIIISPPDLHRLLSDILSHELHDMGFTIEFINISHVESAPILLGKDKITIQRGTTDASRYQVYIQTLSDRDSLTVAYTGKSPRIVSSDLLTGLTYLICDCTYSYSDAHLAEKLELGSYKQITEMYNEIKPQAMFLVHISPKYPEPYSEIDKGRFKSRRILKTYDGYRFDFI